MGLVCSSLRMCLLTLTEAVVQWLPAEELHVCADFKQDARDLYFPFLLFILLSPFSYEILMLSNGKDLLEIVLHFDIFLHFDIIQHPKFIHSDFFLVAFLLKIKRTHCIVF